VPTGALLGFVCLWLWPLDAPTPLAEWTVTRDPQRRRLALRYFAGAVAFAVLAGTIRGTALWMLWIAVSLALVALSYAVLGPGGFQKQPDGRMSAAATALLLPYLAGARINARWWTRGQRNAVKVVDDVWIGRLPSVRKLDGTGVAGIVDMCAELPIDAAGRRYVNHATLDLVPVDAATLSAAAATIERLRRQGPVLVCCALGYSRSAAALAAWLVATGRAASPEAAIAKLTAVRPTIVLSDAHRAQLCGVLPLDATAS
jgi:hypothetical protein